MKDVYLAYYPEILEEMFNQENIDRTFLYTLYSMSDLFYYVHTENINAIDYYLEHYANISMTTGSSSAWSVTREISLIF